MASYSAALPSHWLSVGFAGLCRLVLVDEALLLSPTFFVQAFVDLVGAEGWRSTDGIQVK